MNSIAYFWDFLATVADVQSNIESRFQFSWNQMRDKPTEVSGHSAIYEIPIYEDLSWLAVVEEQTPTYAPFKSDSIKLNKFIVNWRDGRITSRCGYGHESGRFLFADVTEWQRCPCSLCLPGNERWLNAIKNN